MPPTARSAGGGAFDIGSARPVPVHPQVVGHDGARRPSPVRAQPQPAEPLGSARESAPTGDGLASACLEHERSTRRQGVYNLTETPFCLRTAGVDGQVGDCVFFERSKLDFLPHL